MSVLLISPVLIPLLAAIAMLPAWNQPRLQRGISVAAAAALLAAALGLLALVWHNGVQAVQIGSWPAPFGITIVADLFSAIMVTLAGLIGLAVAVYSLASIDHERERFGYHPLVHILLAGVCGAFLTGDIFNLYVWFEVMLISSFVLMALRGERMQLEGAIKYVTLNLMSSALFLAAVGVLYGVTGTLNMADLSRQLRRMEHSDIILIPALLLLMAFGIKAAVFPLFFWLPASYHTPPPAISALFSGLLTKVGVYSMIRVFTLLFVQNIEFTHQTILIISGFTMLVGVLGAVAQNEFRRLLSFHMVSQIGYLIMGLGLFTRLALSGSIFYFMHYILVQANLFLISGVTFRLQGSYQLSKMGGLYREHPWLAGLFLTPALALAGLPPSSGFWAKLTLAKAGFEESQYLIVAISLLVSLLTLYSMLKIWREVFWKPSVPGLQKPPPIPSGQLALLILPIFALAALTFLISLFPEPLFALSDRAAQQLLNPEDYLRKVLGE